MDPDMPGNDTAPGDPQQRAPRPLRPPRGAPRAPDRPPAPRRREAGAGPRAAAHGAARRVAAGLAALLKWLPLRQILVFGIAIVGLYFVWPQLVNLFSHLPQLRGILWFWFVLMGAARGGQLRLRLGADAPDPERTELVSDRHGPARRATR